MKTQLLQLLSHLEITLKEANLWDEKEINEEKLKSTQPFSIDTLEAYQWLQWIFIPKMTNLIKQNYPLPQELSISPYIEEVYKDHTNLTQLLQSLRNIEKLLNQG